MENHQVKMAPIGELFEFGDQSYIEQTFPLEQELLGYVFGLSDKKEEINYFFEILHEIHFSYKPHKILFNESHRLFLRDGVLNIIELDNAISAKRTDNFIMNKAFKQGERFLVFEYIIELSRSSTISTRYGLKAYRNSLMVYFYKSYLKSAVDQNDYELIKDYTAKLKELETSKQDIYYTSCKTLFNKELLMPNEIIAGFLYEGVTLLAGKPKLGKSWLMLDLAISVASSGYFMGNKELSVIDAGNVLYGALEDNERTLQIRLKTYLTNNRASLPDNLDFATQNTISRVNEGGIAQLEHWCKSVKKPRLIIIDTMKTLKPTAKQIGYESDYDATQPYRELVDKYGVAVLLVHHTRKAEANNDPLDAISGSVGLSGSVDSLMVLNRARHENTARLFVTGRLMREQDMALDFKDGVWTYLGDGRLADASALQRKILEAVNEGVDSPNMIAKDINEPLSSVKRNLRQMLDDGLIKRSEYGKYQMVS